MSIYTGQINECHVIETKSALIAKDEQIFSAAHIKQC